MSRLWFELVLCNYSFPPWDCKLLETEMGSQSALNARLFSAMPGIRYNCCLNRLMASISFPGHYLNLYYQITYWSILIAGHRDSAMWETHEDSLAPGKALSQLCPNRILTCLTVPRLLSARTVHWLLCACWLPLLIFHCDFLLNPVCHSPQTLLVSILSGSSWHLQG